MSIFGEEKSAAILAMSLNTQLSKLMSGIRASRLIVLAAKTSAMKLVNCFQAGDFDKASNEYHQLQVEAAKLPRTVVMTRAAVKKMEALLGSVKTMEKISNGLSGQFQRNRMAATPKQRQEEMAVFSGEEHLEAPLTLNIQRCTSIANHLEALLETFKNYAPFKPAPSSAASLQRAKADIFVKHFTMLGEEFENITKWYTTAFDALDLICRSINRIALLETDILKHQMVGR